MSSIIKKANLIDEKRNNLNSELETKLELNKIYLINEIKILNNKKNKIEDKIKILNNIKNKIEYEIKILNNTKKKDNDINTKGNKGEKGEVEVIKKIYNLSKINDIKSLKLIFGENAKDGIIMYNIETNEHIHKENDIKKAKSGCKADFMIKFIKNNMYINCSIKCNHGAMPSILNHTPRSAKVFQEGGDLFTELKNLDILITYLNKERTSGNVGEDIHIKNINISNESKKCIIHVISYFLFNGTGVGKSRYPSNSILEIHEPTDINKWKFYNCIDNKKKNDYIQHIYNRIIISMRDKGMPTKKNLLCDPWIFRQIKENNILKEKGSLHIRLKKQCH